MGSRSGLAAPVGAAAPSGSYRQQIESCEQANKDTLANITKTLKETDDVSIVTAGTLHAQTEQLHRIKNDAEDINHNLDTSQWLLSGMKSWGGRVRSLFGAAPEKPKPEPRPGVTSAGFSNGSSSAEASSSSRTLPPGSRPFSGATAAPAAVGGSKKTILGGFSEEEDKALDGINAMLGDLKDRSKEIGRTIEYQNTLVDDITTQTERAKHRLEDQKKDLKKISGR